MDQEETMKERRVLFAASDGAAHPVYGNGAYAWVSASGRFEVGRAPRHIMMAELTGITKFAKQIPFEVFSKAVLFVDSLRAIDTITAHSSVLWKLPDQEAMMQTLSMIEGGRLELVWVKSHNGHVLNDVADRLALMRHRAVRMALTESEIAAAAERIVDRERENLLAPQWPVERLRALKAWRQLERTHASQRTAALV